MRNYKTYNLYFTIETLQKLWFLRMSPQSNVFCKLGVLGILIMVYSISFAQTTYNVSPDGTGLSSLPGAKNDIQNQTSGMNSDITVLLGDGTYYLNESLEFDVQDGGTETYSVIYKAASGAKPIISGGIKLGNWQQSTENTNIYCTQLTGIDHVRNIYVDGKRAKRARGSVKTGTALYSVNGLKEGILFNKIDIDQYTNPSNVEISYLHRWRDFYFLVQSIEDGATIADVANDKYLVRIKNFNWYYTMGYPVISPGIGGPMDQFYFENALELLDEPGEWYFDSVADSLYYYPLAGQDMNTVEIVAPKLEQLVKIKSASGTSKVKNLRFEGIQFAHSSWSWPSVNGFGTIQGSAVISDNNASAGDVSNNQRKIKLPGAIQIEDAENITFKSNIFTHLGSSAIDLKNNTDTVNIKSNTFYDVSASAISVASWEHRTIDVSGESPVSNTLIKNNYIGNIGIEFASSSAVEGFYTSGMEVDHNELYNMPYTGVSVGWGWHHSLSALANNSVTNNKITGVVQKCYDGGGIYTLSTFDGDGMLIAGNYIDELSLPPRTSNEGVIYADEESSNITIKNNVVKSSRKWFFYNVAGTVSVDSMYVSSSTSNWGGNDGGNTNITLNTNHVWVLPNLTADEIQDNSGIEDGEEPPAIPAVNIALKKASYSSSDFDTGSIASMANDNSTASFWHSGVKDQPWWYVDLSDKYSITSIELVAQQSGTSYEETRRNFVIEASNSSTFPASETEVLYTQGSSPLAERQILVINNPSSNTYKFIRVRKTVSGEHMLVAELRVYGSKETAPNIALNKPSVSSSNFDSGSIASMANDNSTTSFWHSGAKNKPWWYVDLNDTYSISSIELVTRQSGVSYEETRRNFVIEASNNSNFSASDTEVLYTKGSTPIADRQTLTINNPTSNSYRYIRIRKTVTGEHMLVAELRVFGSQDLSLRSAILSTKEIGIDDYKFYPNPVKDNLFLNINGHNEIVTIKMINLTGSTVFVKQQRIHSGETLDINTEGLHSGIYVLNVSGEKINISHKFLKKY